jgi:peptidoglycan/xylan/chitin deacetylase (PgdA/CDA1 family)
MILEPERKNEIQYDQKKNVMSKKRMLANFLDKLQLSRLLPLLNRMHSNRLTVLAYHRIIDLPAEKFSFDYELVSASKKSFELQIQYVKKHFSPISMEQLEDHLENGKKLPKRPLLITFDDGFDDNFYAAFPILESCNVPATIFVSTQYIDTQDVIWFDQLVAFILNMKARELVVPELHQSFALTDNKSEREQIAVEILSAIKRVPNRKRLEILRSIFECEDGGLKSIDFSQSKMLNWEQIRIMNKSVVSFGSHTVSHPILTMLTNKELNHELLASKRVLEEKLSTRVCSIAYPNGGVLDFNDNILREVELSGYKIGFSYISGTNRVPVKNRYAIRRLHIEHYIDLPYFKCLLCLPSIFGGS